MKILVTLLSIFILSLSLSPELLPISDDCATEQVIGDQHDSPCDSECDTKCSPFYSCGNCLCFPLHFSSNATFYGNKRVSQSNHQNFYYQFHGKESFSFKIWQPPQ
jgi:hypothetical protein